VNIRVAFGILSVAVLSAVLVLTFSEKGNSSNEAEKIKHGEYLVNLGGCNDCHSPKVMTEMGPVPDQTRLLSGHPADEKIAEIPPGLISPDGWFTLSNGHFTAWAGPWGVSFAANLTPDEVTGIGAWTEESFIKALRTGKHLGAGRAILPPMPWQPIGECTDEDLSDIFAYLQSIKPIENQVPPPVPPAGK
jgi:mono/diheme cytochrome c family protein